MTLPRPTLRALHPIDRLTRLGAEGYVDRCKRCGAGRVHHLDAGLWRCECGASRPLLTRHATPWWRSPPEAARAPWPGDGCGELFGDYGDTPA